MSLAIQETTNGKIVEVKLTGKLFTEDYETFVPVVDQLVKQHRKLRMLVAMQDFHGWTAGAAWEDTRALHHFRDIERLAIVGEAKWQHGLAVFCKPLLGHRSLLRAYGDKRGAESLGWGSMANVSNGPLTGTESQAPRIRPVSPLCFRLTRRIGRRGGGGGCGGVSRPDCDLFHNLLFLGRAFLHLRHERPYTRQVHGGHWLSWCRSSVGSASLFSSRLSRPRPRGMECPK